MQLADDRCWDQEGWGFTGGSLSYKWDKVYCYFPPYSLLPYCQQEQSDSRGARPELYERSWPRRPKRLLTAKEVQRNPGSGLCSSCRNIKRVYDKGDSKRATETLNK